MDGLASKGLSLTAIIDLTYTNRYYDYRVSVCYCHSSDGLTN